MRWRLYYEDGGTFSSTDGPPQEAPGYGVLGVLDGDKLLISQDYYIYREDYGCWVEVKPDGLVDHLVEAAHLVCAVKAGRSVPEPVWKAAVRRMTEDRNGNR